jgi:glutaredoxin 3
MPRRITETEDVTIYTKPGCPYCAAAKEDLRGRGIRYVELNVKQDGAALRRMLELNGNRRQVPTIVDGGRVQVGFHGS